MGEECFEWYMGRFGESGRRRLCTQFTRADVRPLLSKPMSVLLVVTLLLALHGLFPEVLGQVLRETKLAISAHGARFKHPGMSATRFVHSLRLHLLLSVLVPLISIRWQIMGPPSSQQSP